MSDGPFKPAAQSRHFHGRKHTGLRENLPSTMIRHTDTVRVTGSLGLVLTKVRAIKITRLQKEHTSVNNVGKKSELSQGSKLKNNQLKTDWKTKITVFNRRKNQLIFSPPTIETDSNLF